MPHGPARPCRTRCAADDRSPAGERRRARGAGRLSRARSRRRRRRAFRAMPFSRAGSAASLLGTGRHRDRRRSTERSEALFSHSLLAGDAGGARSRSLAARRHRVAADPSAGGGLSAAAGDQRTAADGGLCAAGRGVFAGLWPCRPHKSRVRRTGGRGRLRRRARRRFVRRRRPRPPSLPCADVRRLRRGDLGNGGEPLGVSAAAPSHRPDRAGRVDRARAVPARVPSPDAGSSPASG